MVSPNTYKRYIDKLDAAISFESIADAKDLQDEILAVIRSELDGLKCGLTNYSYVGIVTDGRTGETKITGDEVDYIKAQIASASRTPSGRYCPNKNLGHGWSEALSMNEVAAAVRLRIRNREKLQIVSPGCGSRVSCAVAHSARQQRRECPRGNTAQ